jgi:signal transduction histidine kinase
MTASDAALLVITAAATVVAATVGMLLVRRARGRTVRVQALLIALTAVGAMIAGTVIAAKAMFISSHDLRALVIVMAASGSIALGAAWQLGRDIKVGTHEVGEIARRLVDAPVRYCAPVARGPGELTELAAELADVSTRLAESRERERALERSRRELIAWMSHDLRGPLATIRAMGEALDDEIVDEPDVVRRYHHQILVDAERLSVLVDDLFELSRIHSGVAPAGDDRASLADVVADAAVGARAAAELKGVRLVDRVSDLPAIEVSSGELTRVLLNLIDNAIRHTPTGGKVVLESCTDDGGAHVSVLDECGGIPDTDLDRVFDIAFRGDVARVKDDGGGGLGLTIARGLVEANAGSIEVVNEERGCRFTVRLPVQG